MSAYSRPGAVPITASNGRSELWHICRRRVMRASSDIVALAVSHAASCVRNVSHGVTSVTASATIQPTVPAGSEPTGAPSVTRYQVWPSALALSVARIATDWPVSAPSRRDVALGNSRRLKNDSVVVPSSGAPAGRAPSVTSKCTSS